MNIQTHLGYVTSILLEDPIDRRRLTFQVRFAEKHPPDLDADLVSAICILLGKYNIAYTVVEGEDHG